MPLSDLPPTLARAREARGYAVLTPVQAAVTASEAGGRDLLVSARTGSGKTVAYGLAMAPELLGDVGSATDAAALPRVHDPLALVIAPTRELALQVQRELEWLYAGAGAQVVSCVGGMDPRREQRALNAGCHVVVGTPGRLRDHLERGNLRLAGLRAVVLDEADEMLDLGFREELEAILDAAPAERRTLLFSATLPKPIVALARRYQRDALRLTVGGGEEGHADIDYRAVAIAAGDVEAATVNLLRFYEAGAALVFCSTREAVRRLHAALLERGFSVVALSGELTQAERTHALQALRDRRARVCVATDVAARGIDIPDLELVVHAELPTDPQVLQHRSGRTGRAGRKGVSAILVPHPRRRRAEAMLRDARIDARWSPAPSADDIRGRDQDRLLERLRPQGEPVEEDVAIARALLADAAPEAVVAALVAGRRADMPSPEELREVAPPPARDAGQTSLVRGPPRPGFEGSSWFSVDIGRHRNAEARWLLPLICRRGAITKREIGAIRVFDRETRFEIMQEAVAGFEASLLTTEEDGARITPLPDPDVPPERDRRPPPRGKFAGPRADRRPAPAPARAPVADAAPARPHTSKRQGGKLAGPNARKPYGKPKREG